MKSILILLSLFFLAHSGPAAAADQDSDLRKEAVQLLERANAVSMSPNLPNLERSDTFRVLDAVSGPREGTFTRVVVQGIGRREEVSFGEYHTINVWTGGHLATVRTSELAPAEVASVIRITPIWVVRFADDDVIRAIVNSASGGRTARCIQFDTIRGKKIQNNELCVDPANGTLLSSKIGEEFVQNSEFFPFAGALMPGKITYSYAGIPKLDISQTMAELKDTTENVLAAPPDAQIRTFCKTFRRAIGQSMPQPRAGNSGRDTEVVIRGIIGMDGKVHQAVVQSADLPDLAAEALELIHQWVFTPAMCDGKPNTEEASFIVRFHGR